QVDAGDPRRKAEVVLDAGARAGLAPGRGRLHDQDIQSFRCPVHGRRQPRWSRPDDDEVADMGLIDGVVEAQGVGDLLIGRVTERVIAARDHHGPLAAVEWERSSSSWTSASRSKSGM